MPDGRGFFPSDKEIFRSHTDVWQGKPTQYGRKKTAQTVCSGCEYRFLETLPSPPGKAAGSSPPCAASSRFVRTGCASGPCRSAVSRKFLTLNKSRGRGIPRPYERKNEYGKSQAETAGGQRPAGRRLLCAGPGPAHGFLRAGAVPGIGGPDRPAGVLARGGHWGHFRVFSHQLRRGTDGGHLSPGHSFRHLCHPGRLCFHLAVPGGADQGPAGPFPPWPLWSATRLSSGGRSTPSFWIPPPWWALSPPPWGLAWGNWRPAAAWGCSWWSFWSGPDWTSTSGNCSGTSSAGSGCDFTKECFP